LSDVDANGGDETLTLTVLNGIVALATLAGLTVDAGANGTATVTVTGTLAELNAALDGLTYTPNANYNGDDTLTVTLNDNGNSGGAALTATSLVPINDTAVNDAPVANDTAAVGNEDGARIAIVLSGADLDAGEAIDSFTIATLAANGQLFDAAVGGNLLNAGAIVAAAANSASVFFQPDPDSNGATSFTYTAFGGALTSAPATADITVNPVNDAPVAQNGAAIGDEDTVIAGTLPRPRSTAIC
jgi:hypothetical protein